MLRRCGVVGYPAAHSLSPALHRAGYAALGLPWTYEAVEVPPGDLAAFVAGLDGSWRGLSVTMPHKADAAALGEPDEIVSVLGVANTLVLGAEPTAHNTDVSGFRWALADAGVPACETATILGNGATARSVLAGLAGMGARTVHVVVREAGRAAELMALASRLGVDLIEQTYADRLPPVDVLASTIPPGAVPADAAASSSVVFDAIYHPWPTPLAKAASARGCTLVSGLDLLVGQALDQFELFTGARVGAEVFRSAGQEELARRAQC